MNFNDNPNNCDESNDPEDNIVVPLIDEHSDSSSVLLSSDDEDLDSDEPTQANSLVSETVADTTEEEDELIKAIKRESVKIREHPPIIRCNIDIVDISFHPRNNLLAIALLNGDVLLYKYSNEANMLDQTLELHDGCGRDIEFSLDGNLLLSVANDRVITISDVQTGKLTRFYKNAHSVPIYCVRTLDENIFATGDDDGVIKLWDIRQCNSTPIHQIKRHEDYISDMLTNEAMTYLIACSGDGSITALDLRQRKFFMHSNQYDEELTCMGLFRTETKLLVSTAKGNMYLYNWREFGLHSDAYSGHNTCVNRLVPITESIAATAGDDGLIRATHLFPNRHLGVVGQHAMAVQSLDISSDGQLLASSADVEVKFWPIGYFAEFANVAATKQTKETKRKELEFQLPSSKRRNIADFFSDM